jgi:hypothetical protein
MQRRSTVSRWKTPPRPVGFLHWKNEQSMRVRESDVRGSSGRKQILLFTRSECKERADVRKWWKLQRVKEAEIGGELESPAAKELARETVEK